MNGSLSYTKQITRDLKNISLVRSQSPAFLMSLYFREIYPDIIYFDADKEGQDIELAISMFPDSIICGDDYIWTDKNNENPIKSCLEIMEQNHPRRIIKNGQSWILNTKDDHTYDSNISFNPHTDAAVKMAEDVEAYLGNCSICGASGTFEKQNWRARESFHCISCGGSLREREQAKTILVNVLRSKHNNLKDLVSSGDIDQLTVYEPGEIGAMRKYTQKLTNYIQTSLQEISDMNVKVEDLQALKFQPNTIDLMISSDIMEHVDNPQQAFKEIFRVLKPGGCHCFTVPLHRETTRSRVKINAGKKMYLEPKHHHGNGKGGQCLVITDFGYDIVNVLNEIGYIAEIVWCQEKGIEKNICGTVVAKKGSVVDNGL
jgi:SAM-dependent methyltransferase